MTCEPKTSTDRRRKIVAFRCLESTKRTWNVLSCIQNQTITRALYVCPAPGLIPHLHPPAYKASSRCSFPLLNLQHSSSRTRSKRFLDHVLACSVFPKSDPSFRMSSGPKIFTPPSYEAPSVVLLPKYRKEIFDVSSSFEIRNQHASIVYLRRLYLFALDLASPAL